MLGRIATAVSAAAVAAGVLAPSCGGPAAPSTDSAPPSRARRGAAAEAGAAGSPSSTRAAPEGEAQPRPRRRRGRRGADDAPEPVRSLAAEVRRDGSVRVVEVTHAPEPAGVPSRRRRGRPVARAEDAGRDERSEVETRLVCELRLELASAERESVREASTPVAWRPATVRPAFGRRPARAVFGRRTMLVTAECREEAGGFLVDFRAEPDPASRPEGPWEEPTEIGARVVAAVPREAAEGSRLTLGATDGDLAPARDGAASFAPESPSGPVEGPPPARAPGGHAGLEPAPAVGAYPAFWRSAARASRPAATRGAGAGPARDRRPARQLLSASGRGRRAELVPDTGPRLVIQGEHVGDMRVGETDEGDYVIRLAEAEADTSAALAFALYVGRRPFPGSTGGGAILLGQPSVTYLERMRCFEIAFRAFADWRDPFDPSEVAVEAAWRAGEGRTGGASGFYARDYRPRLDKAEDEKKAEGSGKSDAGGDGSDGGVERLVGLGWPSFRVRLPERASGGRARVLLAARSGRVGFEAALPAGRLWVAEGPPDGPAALSGVTLDASGWKRVSDAAGAIEGAAAARVRASRFPAHGGDYALEAERPGWIDLAAAWRIDRAFEEAMKHSFALVPVLDRGKPGHEFRASSPYFTAGEDATDRPAARSIEEYFAGERARAAFGRKLRYAAARWGSVPSLAGWEVFDGPDLVAGVSARDAVAAWIPEMTAAMRAFDPAHAASVTLRTGMPRSFAAAEGVLVGRAVELAPRRGTDSRAAYERAREASESTDYLVLEGGNRRALWAAAVGSARPVFLGAPRARDLPATAAGDAPPPDPDDGPADELAALARFLADGPSLGELPRAFTHEEREFRILGRQGPSGAAWWVERLGGRARGSARSPDPDGASEGPELLPVVNDVELVIEELEPGDYIVEWWQAHEGRLLTRTKVRVPDGAIVLRAPAFSSDLAGRVTRQKDY